MNRKMLLMVMMLTAGSGIIHAEGGAESPAGGDNVAPSDEAVVQGEQTPTDRIVARFMALDADESGGVSFDEYMAMVQKRAEARYRAMDVNQDGEVTDEEYRAFWKSRMAKWYRLKR